MNDPHENAARVYNYDRGGNITSKVRYSYTTGSLGAALETIPYTYGDSNWKDELTAYNGKSIAYDAIGNPPNDGTWSFQWQAGRQFEQMATEGTRVPFKYDHNGMRIQKVVERDWYPAIASYTLHGKLISHMTIDYTDFETEQPMWIDLHFSMTRTAVRRLWSILERNTLTSTICRVILCEFLCKKCEIPCNALRFVL